MKIIVIPFLFFGCAVPFKRIDFKYTNLAHMNFKEAQLEVSIDPQKLIFDLSSGFRNMGASILELNFSEPVSHFH